MDEQQQLVVMQLIMAGGNAKNVAFEAIRAAKIGDFNQAKAKLKEADHFLADAHQAQTGMLTAEANGQHQPVSLLMVHGQDHVMTAITFRDLAEEIVALYERLGEKSDS